MAKTKPRKGKNAEITQFPSPPTDSENSDTAAGVKDSPQPNPIEPNEPDEPPQAAQRARKGSDPLPKLREFFDTLARISPADWGSRASVKVYRLAPIFDALVGSKKKYIMLYMAAPAPTEETIKHDCGSGRYRLYLNFKTSGGHQ